MSDYIFVIGAAHEGDYNVRVLFSDGFAKVVDFGLLLIEHPHPQYNRYRNVDQFKTFSIETGNVVWGKNWDLIFPVEQLYRGRVEWL